MNLPLLPVALGCLLSASASQLPPPNIVENGDARSGDASWHRSSSGSPVKHDPAKAGTVEDCDGRPCFVMRNGVPWRQRITLAEDVSGKYILIIARGATERVHVEPNITDLPYLWARLITDPPQPYSATVLQGMWLRSKGANQWGTIYGVFPVPKGVVAVDLMLGQASRKGTPHDGSAARVRNVEVRFFDTEAAAKSYVAVYTAAHDAGK